MRRSRFIASLAGPGLAAALTLLPANLSAQTIRAGFDTEQLKRTGASVTEPIELPFRTNIRGLTADQIAFGDPNYVVVCGDGFVTFGLLSNYCPQDTQWAGKQPPELITGAFTAIAPLYRNLNLSPSSLLGSIGWAFGTVDGRQAWGATWDDVPINTSNAAESRNSFQLVLIDRSADRGTVGDFDVEFNYEFLGLGFDNSNTVFAGAYDMGGLFDPNGDEYDSYTYTVAPSPKSRIILCWVGGTIDNAACTAGPVDPNLVVPEPSTWTLMAAGLGALLFAARRRRA